MSYLTEGPSSISGVSDTGSMRGDPNHVAAAKRQGMIKPPHKRGDLVHDFMLFTVPDAANDPVFYSTYENDEVA